MSGLHHTLFDVAFGAGVVYVIYVIVWYVYARYSHEKVANRKIKSLERHIEEVQMLVREFRLSEELETALPKASISELHSLLRTKKLTCGDLVKFFTRYSYHRSKGLNLIVDYTYEIAMEIAKKHDETLKTLIAENKPFPPLFGIPISLKDVFHLKGIDTVLGAAQNCFKPLEKNGLIIDMLLDAGAIPFVKTACPQLLLINETNSWITGRAINPWKADRSPGGSSGGEAGLLAVGGSPIGLGSDGGGSVRIPANACGLYGIRPTGRRFTLDGHAMPSNSSPSHIFMSAGPMGKNFDDCVRVIESLQDNPRLQREEPMLPSMGWKKQVVQDFSTKKLRVGVLRKFDLFQPCPAQNRVIDETIAALKKAGHYVVEVDIDQKLIDALLFYFFQTAIMSHPDRVRSINGEKIIPEFLLPSIAAYSPNFTKPILEKILLMKGEKRLARVMRIQRYTDHVPFLEMINKQVEDTETFLQYLVRDKLDCLVTPGFPVPALKHGQSRFLQFACVYTFLFNILDMPTVHIPVSVVKKGEDRYSDDIHGEDRITKVARETMEGSVGLPVGIQVSCLPYEDEAVCGIGSQMAKLLKFDMLPL